MSSRQHDKRRVKRQYGSDEDGSDGADPEDGTPRPLPHADTTGGSPSQDQAPAPNDDYSSHRRFTSQQLQAGGRPRQHDAAGLYVFGQTDGTEQGPEGAHPVGHGSRPGDNWSGASIAGGNAGLALSGDPRRLPQRDAPGFRGDCPGTAGQAGPDSQHQATFPPHAFRHDASAAGRTSSTSDLEPLLAPATVHQPLQVRLGPGGQGHGHGHGHPMLSFQQQSGNLRFQLEHNQNNPPYHDVLATPPADVIAPPYPPQSSLHFSHHPIDRHHHHHHQHHQLQHSPVGDPPQIDPSSTPAPPNHEHEPSESSALLCHPHDPRLVQLQPHHPHHHQPHHQPIDAHAASYFPPDAADQHPPLTLQQANFHQSDPRYFFPTPLDHPGHPQPLAPDTGLPLVPYHDAEQISQFYQNLPQWPLAQGPNGLWSPQMYQELSILNAESYNDGNPSFRAPRSLPSLRNTIPARAPATTANKRKAPLKRKNEPAAPAQDPEQPPQKRGRGRPKLSSSEDSPEERRRVQIRLAQRAYRGRREMHKTTLEQKISDLDRVAADMSNAFTQLHDFAIARGMLESDPDFGRRLQATTQTFLKLARKSHKIVAAEVGYFVEEQDESDEQPEEAAEAGPSDTTNPAGQSSGDKVLLAGLIVTHEPDTEAGPPPPSTSAAQPPPGSWSLGDPSSSSSSSHHHPAGSAASYEVVSQPTVHNASFPFGMSLEIAPETTALPITTITTTTSANPLQVPFNIDIDPSFLDPSLNVAPDPYPASFFFQYNTPASQDPYLPPQLPPPSSFSHLERTFGRRLQRAALEQGLRLLHMPDPPPHFYAAVFGFCLLFESRESIVKRLTDCTSINEQETLSNWRFPFLHLGGAGTFFEELNEMDDAGMALNLQDAVVGEGNLGFGVSSEAVIGQQQQQQQQRAPVGNRGLLQPHRSKVAPDSMFGQGPWTPEIESTRDLRVDRKLRIVVPGWEGDFYDCDEIEWYFQQRGVVIPPAADFVTAEIDEDDFRGGEQKPGPTKAFDATIDNFITDCLMKDFVADGGTGGTVAAQLATPSASTGTPMGETELSRTEALFAAREAEPSTSKGKGKAPAVPQVKTFTGGVLPVPAPGKRLVTINVAVLVEELVSRSVCLGRTPGVRPKDVDGAFWSAVTLL